MKGIIKASDAKIFVDSIRNEKTINNIEYLGDDLIKVLSYLNTYMSSDNNKIMISEYYYSKLKSLLKLNNIDTLFGKDVIVNDYLYDEEIIFYNNELFELYYDESYNLIGTYYRQLENISYYNSKIFLREQKIDEILNE